MPVAAIAGIVLGIVALKQLRRVVQAGRGMAITGIALGSLWLLALGVGLGALAIYGAPSCGSSALANDEVFDTTKHVTVNNLEVGDCFDGLSGEGSPVGALPRRRCTQRHEGQMGATVTLQGRWPGKMQLLTPRVRPVPSPPLVNEPADMVRSSPANPPAYEGSSPGGSCTAEANRVGSPEDRSAARRAADTPVSGGGSETPPVVRAVDAEEALDCGGAAEGGPEQAQAREIAAMATSRATPRRATPAPNPPRREGAAATDQGGSIRFAPGAAVPRRFSVKRHESPMPPSDCDDVSLATGVGHVRVPTLQRLAPRPGPSAAGSRYRRRGRAGTPGPGGG